jgi:hypothetical protein
LISSTKDRSFSSWENPALRMLLKADFFITVSVVRVVAKPFGPIDLRQHVVIKAF